MGASQLIYAVVAVAIAAMVSYLLLIGTTTVETRQYQNEMMTQVSGVAHEVFDLIGTRSFDARTDTTVFPDPPSSAEELTAESDFGKSCDPYTGCSDIDDYHEQELTMNRLGTTYSVFVGVRYVEESNPESFSGSKTFAKRVTLTISNPLLRDRDENEDDIVREMFISRVYTYLRTTI